ncbi:MAG: conjugal transfer protein TraB [Betaproteobacteria bacterium]|nr:conjugal transfer protein TraB [Betaproteobacteria bacterium]
MSKSSGRTAAAVEFSAQRLIFLAAVGAVPGLLWDISGADPIGPLFSISLVAAVAIGRNASERLASALGYYASGSWPIIGAIAGYWGSLHPWVGAAAWAACTVALASPWALAASWTGLLFALAVTALPPIGVIGWLSPINAAGMLFPGMGWLGLMLWLIFAIALHAFVSARSDIGRSGALTSLARSHLPLFLPIIAAAHLMAAATKPPTGWVGVQTHILPSGGNILAAIQDNQDVIQSGLHQGNGARVVVFPEAILENWLPGTRQQFGQAVSGQIWLIGAQASMRDAVVVATRGHAASRPVTVAAGLLLGGDWQPWSANTLRPIWLQRTFTLDGKRVWASLCVEQVQPWTWLEAMWQRPDVVLAMSNDWWAAEDNAAPGIQDASTKAWARLMGVPVVWAVNR